jgi:hypothetical protein
MENVLGRCIYFKSFSDNKPKIGIVKQVIPLKNEEGMIVVSICNDEEYRLIFSSKEQIEKSIDIALEFLAKRRETLQDFFESGKDKQMIEDLKKKAKELSKERNKIHQATKRKHKRKKK